MSDVCNFNITKMMKYGVFVGNTGHFDNEIKLAGSGDLGHECRQLQASIDRFVFPSATVWSLLEAYKNEVYLLPKELVEKIASEQEQAVFSVQRVFASFHLRLLFPNSSMRKWRIWPSGTQCGGHRQAVSGRRCLLGQLKSLVRRPLSKCRQLQRCSSPRLHFRDFLLSSTWGGDDSINKGTSVSCRQRAVQRAQKDPIARPCQVSPPALVATQDRSALTCEQLEV